MDLNIVNNEEKFLAGKLEGYTLKGAENKFDDKGNPLLFPGCTIICNIPLNTFLLYTSPSPRDRTRSRMPSSA